MRTLLHIDASPRGDRSVSRQLTRGFALAWKEANPDAPVIYRDLGHDPVPLVTETFIAAVYTPPEGKKATVIMSRGWFYRNGSPLAACNLQEPWIRMILGFVGVTDIDFVVAEGTAHLDRGKGEREEYLHPIREQVRLKATRQGSPRRFDAPSEQKFIAGQARNRDKLRRSGMS